MLREEINAEKTRVHHWSDAGMMIRQSETGIEYEDAVDVLPCKYTYTETENPIPTHEEEAEIGDYEEAMHSLGVIE